MKKNGFTLVELICVIMLLSIIITLSTIAIINILKNSREKENSASMELIKTATKDYMNKYENNYYIKNGVSYCIEIQTLINENFLISNISYDGNKINDKVVKVSFNNNEYVYELDEKETCILTETDSIN